MGGFFGVASKEDCVFDLFFGTDYHSHLGTRRAGMAVYSRDYGFDRAIHNIENAPFRTKFDREANEMKGNIGIGSISDYEPQPLIVRSHHGTYSIATVGKINNTDDILSKLLFSSHMHFLEMSGGTINATELVATIINQKENLIEGIQYAQEIIDGSMTILLMTPKGIYAARDRLGRTPVAIGKKDNAYCVSFESFAYLNLGYTNVRELGPGEIAIITPEGVKTLVEPGKDMKICTFLWVYYGYPSSSYEGISVEKMRYNCGASMAKRDHVSPDRCSGFGDGACHRLCECFRHSLFQTLHQVYSHLAPFLHAHHPEQTELNCQDETDSCARSDSGPQDASDRRFHRARHAAKGNHRVSVLQRSEGGSHPSGLPASSVWLQIPELLPFHLGNGSDHPTGHPGYGRRRTACGSGCLRRSGVRTVSDNGGKYRETAQLHFPAL